MPTHPGSIGNEVVERNGGSQDKLAQFSNPTRQVKDQPCHLWSSAVKVKARFVWQIFIWRIFIGRICSWSISSGIKHCTLCHFEPFCRTLNFLFQIQNHPSKKLWEIYSLDFVASFPPGIKLKVATSKRKESFSFPHPILFLPFLISLILTQDIVNEEFIIISMS